MSNKQFSMTSIKKFIKQEINLKILFIAFGLGLIQSGKIILFTNGTTKKIYYFLSNLQLFKNFFKLFAQADLSSRSSGVILIIIGIILLIFLSCFLVSKNKISLYTIWSLINVFLLIPGLLLDESVNLLYLISITTWGYFAIIWLVKELYSWTIKSPNEILPRLTFLWGIIIAIIGFMIKEN
ncbi:hypothetical protein PT287_09655 [Lactobacillus sp. ESL0679]|uniref:hypothetical protein n=1 Tax=Lactobacillus sp. ESL0679 TaxID=2983209 RepID=UPI0023F8F8F7|nr:hypothetical protein [Lactobacillus sp. ESL0679]MDF7683762.1 hypothetical protein [Lactobacillus sp. ESL0679]